MSATGLSIRLAGLLMAGIVSAGPLPSAAAETSESQENWAEQAPSTPQPPDELELVADRQSYDQRRGITIAEGNVQAVVGTAVLRADRIEFDAGFRTLYALSLIHI